MFNYVHYTFYTAHMWTAVCNMICVVQLWIHSVIFWSLHVSHFTHVNSCVQHDLCCSNVNSLCSLMFTTRFTLHTCEQLCATWSVLLKCEFTLFTYVHYTFQTSHIWTAVCNIIGLFQLRIHWIHLLSLHVSKTTYHERYNKKIYFFISIYCIILIYVIDRWQNINRWIMLLEM